MPFKNFKNRGRDKARTAKSDDGSSRPKAYLCSRMVGGENQLSQDLL